MSLISQSMGFEWGHLSCLLRVMQLDRRKSSFILLWHRYLFNKNDYERKCTGIEKKLIKFEKNI